MKINKKRVKDKLLKQ